VEQIRNANRRKPFLIAAAAILVIGFSVWALFLQLSASKGADELRTMTDVKDDLAPEAAKIRSLLKKEEALNKIATAYTDIQDDQTYWFDLLGEVREAFASDSVWLTELSPVYGFDPNPSQDPGAQVIKPQHVIPSNFASQSTGVDSLITSPQVVVEDKPKKKAKNKKTAAAPEIVANAIVIRGFWRENPRSQNVVSDLLKNLRENSTMFKFTVPDPNSKPGRKNDKSKEIILSDEQLLKPSASGGEDDLGFPFELILPLAKPVAVK
jgi:malate synthase